jgi:hypothetical protein
MLTATIKLKLPASSIAQFSTDISHPCTSSAQKISLVNHSNKIRNNMLYSTWSFLGTSFRTQRRQRAYKDVSSVSDNNFTCTSTLMSLNDNIYEDLSCCNSLLQILLCMEYTDHASSFTKNGTYFAILHSDNNVVCHDSLPAKPDQM